MEGNQGESALPDDSTFNQINYNCDTPSFKRSRTEFGISPSTDFHFTEGNNHGLGSVFTYITNVGPSATSESYLGGDIFTGSSLTKSIGSCINSFLSNLEA